MRLTTGKFVDGHEPRVDKYDLPSFPRAMFGLPINFEFPSRRDAGTPITTQLSPKEYNRMASPLILKARSNNGSFESIALKMPIRHMEKMSLHLEYTGNTEGLLDAEKGPWDFERKCWWPICETKAKEQALKIPPLNKHGSDALTAFMNYFESKNGGIIIWTPI